MAVYPGLTGANSIGTLLRMIREQKSESPMVAAETEPNTPMREMIDQPYYGPESPGTNRMVSLRPEQPQPGEMGEASMTPMRSRVGPIGIGGGGEMLTAEGMGNPAAPAAPRPVPTIQSQGPAQQSSGPAPSGQPQSQGQVLGENTAQAAYAPAAEPTQQQLARGLILKTLPGGEYSPANQLKQLEQFKQERAAIPTPTPTPTPKYINMYNQGYPKTYATTITINGKQMKFDPISNTYKQI